jgi:sulfate adenylyltransferase subunit 1
VVRVGDRVRVLPAGRETTVVGIDFAGTELTEAFAPMSVTLRLADEVDITRGELIAGADDAPSPTQDVDGLVCWLSDRALRPGSKVLLKHTTRTVQGIVKEIKGRLDLDTLAPVPAEALTLNDIGRVSIRLAAPIVAENYSDSRRTGAFLLVDPQMGSTLAAGMVRTTLGGDEFEAETLDWSI